MAFGPPVHAPEPSPEEIVAHLRQRLGDAFEYAFVDHGRVVCRVRKDAWVDAVRFVREDPALGCSFFSWLSAIDWTEAEVADAEAAASDESEAAEGTSQPSGTADSDPVGTPTGGSAEGSENSETTVTGATQDSGSSEDDSSSETSTPEVRPARPEPDSQGIAPYFQPTGELFEVCCHLSAPERGFGVTLKTAVDKDNPRLPSLVNVVKGADWHERECHEMFGIVFEGHPNLVKLYLPEKFEGHPLRKTYLLGARVVKPWPGLVDPEDIPPELEPELDALARGGEGE